VARTFATAAALGYIAAMSLRDTLKKKLQTVVDRLSGEYSAGSGEIRPDTGPKEGEAEVKVTRARLRRPSAASEKGG
jgi:hypothetical protein